ncbi:MAG: carbamate kinase [Chloroflexota bacterium]
MELAVVALGGNSLIRPGEKGTAEQQIQRLNETILSLKPLMKGYFLVITHGNGPQVGNLLLQQERCRSVTSEMPLDALDAMTQGQLGYWIQQSVENILKRNAVTIVTRVLVDRNDPGFRSPTKPIGPYYEDKVYPDMVKEPAGWRRVVASPRPVAIVDIEEIEALVRDSGFVVIACGGGGIPVIKEGDEFIGIEAVIDKDFSSAKLATQLKAESLIILTYVPCVYRNYGKPDQKPISKLTIAEAKVLLAANEFGEGSMKPKIEASLEFLAGVGKRVLITSQQELGNALAGKSGTVIK